MNWLVRWWNKTPCERWGHEWSYLKTPWGPLRDYCVVCERTESEINRSEQKQR